VCVCVRVVVCVFVYIERERERERETEPHSRHGIGLDLAGALASRPYMSLMFVRRAVKKSAEGYCACLGFR